MRRKIKNWYLSRGYEEAAKNVDQLIRIRGIRRLARDLGIR